MKKWISLLLTLCLLLTGCSFEYVPPQDEPTQHSASVSESSGDSLLVHFLDVGQADCILIEYGEFYMLIDGGNRDDSQMVVSYLDQQGIDELDVMVCTHAHEDHVGGLPAVLAVYPTAAIYAPTTTYSSKIFEDFLYYADQQDQEIIIPQPGEWIDIGDLEITFLGPVKSYAETNDTSIVCRIDFGETSFLFTGDMEVAAENDMLDLWSDYDWEVDVLKVGHHGSNTSTGYRFLYATNPTYGVISVGEDNSYGHPHDEPMSRLNDAGVTLFRTDEMGTVLAVSDGREITFTWENQDADPSNAEAVEMTYIGNKNSKKFHAPSCDSLPSEKNRIEFATYQDAIDAGYSPCGGCLG